MKKVMLISSLGGHLEQLLNLNEVIKKYDPHIVTEKNSSTEKLQQKYGRLNYLPYISRKNLLVFFLNYLKCFYISGSLFLKIKPDVVITTGAGCVIPMCLLAKLFGKQLIFIETFSRIDSKTMTGKLCYYFADVFIVQWEGLKKNYPKAIFLGSIY